MLFGLGFIGILSSLRDLKGYPEELKTSRLTEALIYFTKLTNVVTRSPQGIKLTGLKRAQ